MIKRALTKKFKMEDLGEIKTYLGINIEYDLKRNFMTLDQKNCTYSISN